MGSLECFYLLKSIYSEGFNRRVKMHLSDEQITALLIEYVSDERYQQAILIDGDWGSGKTHFIQERLLSGLKDCFPDPKRSAYYISLYGMENFSQIMDEIYAASLEDYFDKKLGDGKGEKIHRGMNFAVKLLSTGLKYFSIDTADLPTPSEFLKLKNAVLIFDDLERCNIDVNQLFGFMNNLVEHNNIKVIIVANQTEIGKVKMSEYLPQKYSVVLNKRLKLMPENGSATEQQKNDCMGIDRQNLLKYTEQIFSEDALYEKVKEKLIGLTIYYQADLKRIYESIISKYVVNESEREYLNAEKELILTIFERKQHYNIRTLIFAVMALDKLLKIIEKITFQPQEYIGIQKRQIINYVVELSIHLKTAKKPYSWSNSTAQSGMINLTSDSPYSWENRIYGYKFVDEYLLNRFLDAASIQSHILFLMLEQKSIDENHAFINALKYNLLYSWWELEDSQIEQLLKDILQELSEMKYHPRYFKNMIITLMQLNYHGFNGIDFKRYVDLMELRLEQKEDEFKNESLHVLSDDKVFVADYMKIAQPLLTIIENKERKAKEIINDSLKIDKSWGDVFYKGCCDNKQNYLSDKKFFFYLEPEKIIGRIKGSSVKDLYLFLDGIKEVYSFSNLNDFFKADIEHIAETIDKLNIEQLSEEKITKKLVLTKLYDKLQESLKLITNSI